MPGKYYNRRRIRDVIIADVLILMSMTAAAFYAVYALEKFSLPAPMQGRSHARHVEHGIGNVVFGFLADHFGHRVNWLILQDVLPRRVSWLLCIQYFAVWPGLLFMACTTTLQGISRLSLLAELSAERSARSTSLS